MRTFFTVVLLTLLATACFAVELTDFTGTIAVKNRNETEQNWFSDPRTGNFGDPYQTIENNRVRAGYRLGMKIKIYDNLSAGLTFRSGMGSVMVKEINDISGLQPGVQEAYISWRLFQEERQISDRNWKFNTNVELGIIPQVGNAMWDLYAAHNQTDNPGRADDPRYGTFEDRMGGLNGARVSIGLGPLTLRGVYHTDKVEGRRIKWDNSSSPDDNIPDKYVILGGAELRGAELLSCSSPALKDMVLTVGFDYGVPYRVGNWYKNSKDSVYFDETIWGIDAKVGPSWALFGFGYGENERDSVYLSRYWDYKLTLGTPQGLLPQCLEDLQFVVDYQFNSQIHKFGQYNGHNISRDALHLYFNKKILNLDWQPRVILFQNKVDDVKVYTDTMIDITASVTFNLMEKK